ncbi:FAD-dependent oxidoreductase [Kordia sp. YSTF-M3]|uniref:FAD-dependent oxidoreductase n=1 Tax=Kordia aestuariivivens TaxID=2759037 RepID=A0ABR7QE10_9FLAO|nr:FAD-dependent oxidoreductase [Kordia aestuariivivens]MBC8756770.1 FAD-dependent oxidoreductase [Kordia aestuariivivens]
MKKEAYKIYIVGAGISGLIAAKVLENHGFHPIIIEATDRVGGRVKTDIVNGYQLDHGFQVLLTAYPAAKAYLDYETLDLQEFLPGTTIFSDGKRQTIGDPLRKLSLLFPTLFSGIGTFSDKLKILKLNTSLKKKSLTEIFEQPETTTLAYLQNLGFSEAMISQFFKPFFSGIFLESKLETSSRMFEFVYKMFGEGFAVLPKAGIEAIPKQLSSKLKQTTFHFNTRVQNIEDGKITLENSDILESNFTIVATEASNLISNLKSQETEWKSCDTLYFETSKRMISKPLIGLIADSNSLINNIFYHHSLQTTSSGDKELLSVTIVDSHDLSSESLIEKVKEELKLHCGIDSCTFLKQYTIPKALPNLQQLQYTMLPSETRLTTHTFLAGDVQLNGSVNAAMLAGEAAALGVIEALKSSVNPDDLKSEYS